MCVYPFAKKTTYTFARIGSPLLLSDTEDLSLWCRHSARHSHARPWFLCVSLTLPDLGGGWIPPPKVFVLLCKILGPEGPHFCWLFTKFSCRTFKTNQKFISWKKFQLSQICRGWVEQNFENQGFSIISMLKNLNCSHLSKNVGTTMKLGQITYFMSIYDKKWKFAKISQFSSIFPDSPDFSDFNDFPDI